jgi:non-specific serine/threonine protein kinase
MDALLDFSVAVSLGDDKLTAAELRQLLASSDGLVRLRGQWVELDRERLREVLAHWERGSSEKDVLSVLGGMRTPPGPLGGRC